jgi:hypothetical protein
MTRLEFGKPTTFDQALMRLPNIKHPLYESDTNIQHLSHTHEKILELAFLNLHRPNELADTQLEERLIPLSTEDVHLLEKSSFRRDSIPMLIVQWRYLDPLSDWGQCLPSGTYSFRWWKIAGMHPDFPGKTHKLVCIESNNVYKAKITNIRNNANSDFDIGIVSQPEIDTLINLLS